MLTGLRFDRSTLLFYTFIMQQTVITKTADKPGKTIAIFGGIHGNEKIGVLLIDQLIQSFAPASGTVHFVYGNPRAIEQNLRFTETNLNRNLIKTQNPISYEEKRAQELMELLDGCDALLDLHAYNEEDMQVPVFAICEKPAFPVMQQLPIPTVLSGFNDVQKGSTNGYMENSNKVAVVLELGSVLHPERHMDLAKECVMNFLQYFGITENGTVDHTQPTFLEVASVHRRNSKLFNFTKQYASFDIVKKGEVIAHDGALQLQAARNATILFPRPDAAIGAESFWLLDTK